MTEKMTGRMMMFKAIFKRILHSAEKERISVSHEKCHYKSWFVKSKFCSIFFQLLEKHTFDSPKIDLLPQKLLEPSFRCDVERAGVFCFSLIRIKSFFNSNKTVRVQRFFVSAKIRPVPVAETFDQVILYLDDLPTFFSDALNGWYQRALDNAKRNDKTFIGATSCN